MVSENCLKISYKGLTCHITCNTKFQYDDLIKTVMDKFNIEDSCKLAIEFYDEQGNKYNKNTFEYLLLLFPNPQKIFFIRLDSTKLLNRSKAKEGNERLPFGQSELNNKETIKNLSVPDYCEAVPVRRQNCFLGELPGLTSTGQPSLTSNHDHADYLSLEMVKKFRLLKKSPLKKKHLNNPNVFKRSLRI